MVAVVAAIKDKTRCFIQSHARVKNKLIPFVVFVLMMVTASASQAATIVVPAGGDLQAALNAARFGDTIVLQAGATYIAPPLTHGSPFILPAKTGGTGTDADYITVQTSAIGELPTGRVSPADKAKLAKILAIGPAGAISAARGAKYWRLIGLEITNQSDGSAAHHVNSLVWFGASPDPVLSGEKIVFDRCYVHSQEDGTTNYYRTATRGFFANSGSLTIKNSYVSGFTGFYAHDRNQIIDAEAFASVVGGPFFLDNNFLQATFNPIFLGGGDPGTPDAHTATLSAGATLNQATLSSTTDLQVGDKIALENPYPSGGDQFSCGTITSISGNTITYTTLVRNEGGERFVTSSVLPKAGGQARWRGYTLSGFNLTHSTVDIDTAAAQFVLSISGSKPKAYAEIKLLENSLWEGNIFQGWPTGIAITLRNQNGYSPWSNVKDVTFRSNLFTAFSSLLIAQLFSGDRLSEIGSNIKLINNLAYGGISNSVSGTFPSVMMTTGPGTNNPVTIQHNTIINRQDIPGGSMIIGTSQMSGVVMKDNVMYFNNYGAGCGESPNTFAQCWPNFTENKNVIIDNTSAGSQYITGSSGNFRASFYAASENAVGFIDLAGKNFRLGSNSPYRNAASDGTDVGVNMDALLAALNGQTPSPTPTPTPTPSPSSSPTPNPTPSPTPTPSVPPPTPTPTPSSSPTPVPGSRFINGYVKVNGEYFTGNSTVTLSSAGQPVRSYASSSGGYFEFASAPVGSTLTATSAGYVFQSLAVDTSSPYFIINGTTGSGGPTPTPTPAPTPTPTPAPTPIPTPTPTSAPINVAITNPSTNSTFSVGTTVSFSATASHTSGGSVSSVAYQTGSQLIGTATSAPYTVASSSLIAGVYSVTAVARDSQGRAVTSSPITVKISKALKAVRNTRKNASTIEGSSTSGAISATASSNQIDALVSEVEQTYFEFHAERAMFESAGQIDKYLFAALFLARSSASLAKQPSQNDGIANRMRKLAAYLSFCEDLMVNGAISQATFAGANRVNARADLIITQPNTLPLAGSMLSPNGIARISATSSIPFGSQTTSGNSYELGEVSVTIKGQAAEVLSVSPTSITFRVPSDLTGGLADILVICREGYISYGTASVSGLNPFIFMRAGTANGPGAIVNALNVHSNTFAPTTPQILGLDTFTRLSIMATGISTGLANTDSSNDIWLETGQILPNLAESVVVQARTSSGTTYSLLVEYAGAQGVLSGLDQVNVLLPATLAGAGPVELTVVIGSVRSNSVTIVVQ